MCYTICGMKNYFIYLQKIKPMDTKYTISNPFIEGINIPDELFCDRKEETKEIIKLLKNGNKIVLKAPRRIGKSSLIYHILKQKDICENYNTMYIDLFGTNSANEFVREFQKSFIKQKFTRLDTVKEILKSLPDKLALETEFNELTQTWRGRLGFLDLKEISLGLETIFECLEKTDKPNIVVFDEFQQINYYPEPMAAILRTFIQKSTNTKFIFSGSSRRMLTTMFDSYGEPFYHSAESVELDIISVGTYKDFCLKNFNKYEKKIEESAIEFAYELVSGNTYEMQRIMRSIFASTEVGKAATIQYVKDAVNRILERQDQTYREKVNFLNNKKERKVLLAIALEGVGTNMLSQKMIEAYKLGATSSVAQSLEKLCSEDGLNLVLKIGNSYKLQDKMFELWIAKQYDQLEMKFALANQQFIKELESEKQLNLPKF